MGCCCSKPVDESLAGTPSKGGTQQKTQQETRQETQQGMQPKGETQGETPSKPVDEPLAETPSKGETRQETQSKGETQGETPPKRNRARDMAILLLSFTSSISEASDLLKPMKAMSEIIKKILEVTKVSFNLPDETSLFTKSQRAWRR